MTLTPKRVAEIEVATHKAVRCGNVPSSFARYTATMNYGELRELCAAWRDLQRVKTTVNLLTHQCNGYVAIVNESPTSPDTQPLNG